MRHSSGYADDVVMFIRPVASDLELTSAIFHVFGTTTRLKTNIQKSSATPIQCSEEHIELLQLYMPCEIKDFLCKYLGPYHCLLESLPGHNSN